MVAGGAPVPRWYVLLEGRGPTRRHLCSREYIGSAAMHCQKGRERDLEIIIITISIYTTTFAAYCFCFFCLPLSPSTVLLCTWRRQSSRDCHAHNMSSARLPRGRMQCGGARDRSYICKYQVGLQCGAVRICRARAAGGIWRRYIHDAQNATGSESHAKPRNRLAVWKLDRSSNCFAPHQTRSVAAGSRKPVCIVL